ERSGAIFISPQIVPEGPPQKGHLKHDFRLTERLLPDSTMTYRGRSDGLVVESDRKKKCHIHTDSVLVSVLGFSLSYSCCTAGKCTFQLSSVTFNLKSKIVC